MKQIAFIQIIEHKILKNITYGSKTSKECQHGLKLILHITKHTKLMAQ